jgi:hypothetical protein
MKTFEFPECECIHLDDTDVIITSGCLAAMPEEFDCLGGPEG